MAQTINVNMTPNLFQPALYWSQGDIGREVRINLVSNDGDSIPSGATVTMQATKPSGLGFTCAGTLADNVATFETTDVMTDEYGRYPAEIKVVSGGDTIFSANFIIVSEKNTHPEGTTDGSAETLIPELTLLIERAENAAQTAVDDAIAAADTKVNEILDNLPQEVSDLKSDSDKIKAVTVTVEEVSEQEDILPDITWTEGQYIAPDGTILANATLKYSNKITVSEGDVIDLKPLSSAFRWVCAYNGSTAVSGSGAENVATYTVPSGIDSIVVSAYVDAPYVPTAIIRSYTGVIYKNIIQADNFVEKDGTEQVKSSNIFGMAKTDKKILSDNLFSSARLYASGNFPNYDSVNDVIWLQPNASYDTYIIPVDGISDYKFTFVRFAFLVNSDTYTEVASGLYGNPDPVDGVAITNATSITATDAKYILFAFAPSSYPPSDYSINRVDDVYDIPTNWNVGIEPQRYSSVNGSIASDGTMQITGGTAIKDGHVITFKGFISSFNKVRLRFLSAWDNTETNYIEVDGTNITVKNSTATATAEAHGLNIQNDFALIVEFIDGNIKVTIESNGSIFAKTYTWYQISATVTYPSILSTGSVFTSAVLNKVYSSAKRDIWYFGDSYISFGDVARWTYYAHEYGYDKNALLSGASGGNTVTAKLALDTLVNFGKPKYAVLATGMNDGSDTESAPSSLWTNYKNQFIEECENNGIEPILCTIPTVPTVNNEQKNAWVKSSGYRYIDFAKAVGANASGVWYGDMLSNDGIHPSASGAKALFTQVLIDLPEITVEQ